MGCPYILWGDVPAAMPSWLDVNNAGIKTKETLHIQSDGNLVLQEGTKNVAREKDDLDVGTLQGMGRHGATRDVHLCSNNRHRPRCAKHRPSVSLAGIVAAGTGNAKIKG